MYEVRLTMTFLKFFSIFIFMGAINGHGLLGNSQVKFPLFDSNDGVYLKFELGTPSQQFNLRISPNSSYVWLPSDKCDSQRFRICKKTVFRPDQSSTYKSDGEYKSFVDPSFGGDLKGYLGSDVSQLGPVKLENLDFFAIDSASIYYLPMKVEGDLGLAPRKVDDYQTLMENIASSKVFPAKFSIFLPRLPDDVPHHGDPAYWNISIGEIVFGGSDPSKYNPPMNFAPTSQSDQWQVSASSIRLGELSICKNCPIAVDLIGDGVNFPGDIYFSVLDSIGAMVLPGSGNVFVVCQTIPSLPSLDITLGDFTLSLQPSEYILSDQNPDSPSCYPVFGVDNKITLGKAFLQKFLVEFDYENKRMGFAAIKYDY